MSAFKYGWTTLALVVLLPYVSTSSQSVDPWVRPCQGKIPANITPSITVNPSPPRNFSEVAPYIQTKINVLVSQIRELKNKYCNSTFALENLKIVNKNRWTLNLAETAKSLPSPCTQRQPEQTTSNPTVKGTTADRFAPLREACDNRENKRFQQTKLMISIFMIKRRIFTSLGQLLQKITPHHHRHQHQTRSRTTQGTPSKSTESTRTIPLHVTKVCQLYKKITVVAVFVNQIKELEARHNPEERHTDPNIQNKLRNLQGTTTGFLCYLNVYLASNGIPVENYVVDRNIVPSTFRATENRAEAFNRSFIILQSLEEYVPQLWN